MDNGYTGIPSDIDGSFFQNVSTLPPTETYLCVFMVGCSLQALYSLFSGDQMEFVYGSGKKQPIFRDKQCHYGAGTSGDRKRWDRTDHTCSTGSYKSRCGGDTDSNMPLAGRNPGYRLCFSSHTYPFPAPCQNFPAGRKYRRKALAGKAQMYQECSDKDFRYHILPNDVWYPEACDPFAILHGYVRSGSADLCTGA